MILEIFIILVFQLWSNYEPGSKRTAPSVHFPGKQIFMVQIVAELQQFCKDEWFKIPPQSCKRLIARNCKRFLSIIVGSSPYKKKRIEVRCCCDLALYKHNWNESLSVFQRSILEEAPFQVGSRMNRVKLRVKRLPPAAVESAAWHFISTELKGNSSLTFSILHIHILPASPPLTSVSFSRACA